MPYQFLEDVAIADVAFSASGENLRELFSAAVDATVQVMADNLEAVAPVEERTVELEAEAVDLLLWKLLQEIVFYKDAQLLLLRVADIHVHHEGERWQARVLLHGEKLDVEKHRLRVDVKAVTLHKFRVEKKGRHWEAFVILDI
jgi:SHS2 domain-containing protein